MASDAWRVKAHNIKKLKNFTVYACELIVLKIDMVGGHLNVPSPTSVSVTLIMFLRSVAVALRSPVMVTRLPEFKYMNKAVLWNSFLTTFDLQFGTLGGHCKFCVHGLCLFCVDCCLF